MESYAAYLGDAETARDMGDPVNIARTEGVVKGIELALAHLLGQPRMMAWHDEARRRAGLPALADEFPDPDDL